MAKIGSIINGHMKELVGSNQDLSDYRIGICRKCPLCTDTAIGLICNRFLWINKDTLETSKAPRDGYVRGCGCRLDAKTRNEDDSCIIDKW